MEAMFNLLGCFNPLVNVFLAATCTLRHDFPAKQECGLTSCKTFNTWADHFKPFSSKSFLTTALIRELFVSGRSAAFVVSIYKFVYRSILFV
jgi:hypothetical protein